MKLGSFAENRAQQVQFRFLLHRAAPGETLAVFRGVQPGFYVTFHER